MYLPSNGAIANAVHHELDLCFHGHKISENLQTYNIWQTVRANENCSITTFVEVDASYRMTPLRMLYIVTLTLIFQGHDYFWKYINI